jgi:hypothetical protein
MDLRTAPSLILVSETSAMMRKRQEDRDRRSEKRALYDSKDESELVREQRTRSTR